MILIHVECYSGYKADERPVRFTIGERVLQVDDVEDRWYSPGVSYFRVKAADGNFYVLRHEEAQDFWTLESFRATKSPE